MVEEFGSEKLELLKQGVYPYDYIDSFERFIEEKLLNKECFYSFVKESDGDYLTWKKFGKNLA